MIECDGPPSRPGWRARGSAGAGLGLAGLTDLIAPGAVSARFRRLDRAVYSPLCIALAVLLACSGEAAIGPILRRK